MSQPRSGYVIALPLGLWSSIEIEFEVNVDTPTIQGVSASVADGGNLYDVPRTLQDLVDAYLRTWLMEPHPIIPGNYQRVAWTGAEHWHETTIARLDDLVEHDAAIWSEDLDD